MRILSNADIIGIEVEVPQGHQHLRTVLRLSSGEELVLQEATVANLLRAFVTVKTHPQRMSCRLRGRELGVRERKKGYAGWQLLEDS